METSVERSTPILVKRLATAEIALNVTKVSSHGTILRCQNFSPHGRFAPCMDISPHGRFATDVSPHGRGATRPYTIPKTFHLAQTLALFPSDAIFYDRKTTVSLTKKNMCLCPLHDSMHVSL